MKKMLLIGLVLMVITVSAGFGSKVYKCYEIRPIVEQYRLNRFIIQESYLMGLYTFDIYDGDRFVIEYQCRD